MPETVSPVAPMIIVTESMLLTASFGLYMGFSSSFFGSQDGANSAMIRLYQGLFSTVEGLLVLCIIQSIVL